MEIIQEQSTFQSNQNHNNAKSTLPEKQQNNDKNNVTSVECIVKADTRIWGGDLGVQKLNRSRRIAQNFRKVPTWSSNVLLERNGIRRHLVDRLGNKKRDIPTEILEKTSDNGGLKSLQTNIR